VVLALSFRTIAIPIGCPRACATRFLLETTAASVIASTYPRIGWLALDGAA